MTDQARPIGVVDDDIDLVEGAIAVKIFLQGFQGNNAKRAIVLSSSPFFGNQTHEAQFINTIRCGDLNPIVKSQVLFGSEGFYQNDFFII